MFSPERVRKTVTPKTFLHSSLILSAVLGSDPTGRRSVLSNGLWCLRVRCFVPIWLYGEENGGYGEGEERDGDGRRRKREIRKHSRWSYQQKSLSSSFSRMHRIASRPDCYRLFYTIPRIPTSFREFHTRTNSIHSACVVSSPFSSSCSLVSFPSSSVFVCSRVVEICAVYNYSANVSSNQGIGCGCCRE